MNEERAVTDMDILDRALELTREAIAKTESPLEKAEQVQKFLGYVYGSIREIVDNPDA